MSWEGCGRKYRSSFVYMVGWGSLALKFYLDSGMLRGVCRRPLRAQQVAKKIGSFALGS